jgi:hypothetical protein
MLKARGGRFGFGSGERISSSDVQLPDDGGSSQDHRRHGVEVEHDGGKKDLERILHSQTRQDPQVVGAPSIEGNQDADRRRSRIDEIGEFLTGGPKAVKEGACHGARHQNGDVGLDEDDHADDPRQPLGPLRRVHPVVFLKSLNEAANPTGRLDRGDQGSDHKGKEQDLRISRIGEDRHRAINGRAQACGRIPSVENGPSQPDPTGQRQVNLSRRDRQEDGE